MKYKYLAATVYLCITFISLTASVTAEQLAVPGDDLYHETSSLTSSATQVAGITKDPTSLNLLDTVWIFGFTVAGLVLLRKVQGK